MKLTNHASNIKNIFYIKKTYRLLILPGKISEHSRVTNIFGYTGSI